jgi:hypothetical protein
MNSEFPAFGDSRSGIWSTSFSYSSGCADECFSNSELSVTVGFGDLNFDYFEGIPFSLSSEEFPPDEAVLLELIF